MLENQYLVMDGLHRVEARSALQHLGAEDAWLDAVLLDNCASNFVHERA